MFRGRIQGKLHCPDCQTSRWISYGLGCLPSGRCRASIPYPGRHDGGKYVDILWKQLFPYFRKTFRLAFGHRLVFQQDNDPKHTCNKAKNWFQANEVKLMEWPAQSRDLNSIENLWNEVAEVVQQQKPVSLDEL